jgi:hypothetical protein
MLNDTTFNPPEVVDASAESSSTFPKYGELCSFVRNTATN